MATSLNQRGIVLSAKNKQCIIATVQVTKETLLATVENVWSVALTSQKCHPIGIRKGSVDSMFELVPGITIFMPNWVFALLCLALLVMWTTPMWQHAKIPEIPERPRKFLAAFIITLFGCAVASIVLAVAIMSFDK